MFEVVFSTSADDDLAELTAREYSTVVDEIHEQLSHQPQVKTKKRKQILGEKVPWDPDIEQCWQLTIVPYRVFYEIEIHSDGREYTGRVLVWFVRIKLPGQTTNDLFRKMREDLT